MLGFTPLSVGPISSFPYSFPPASGVYATGAVGTVTLAIGDVISVTGVSATGRVGTVTIGQGKTVQITGLSATGVIDHACLERWSAVDTNMC